MKVLKFFVPLLLIFALLFCSCSDGKSTPQAGERRYTHDGVSIILNDDFTEKSVDGYDAVYVSAKASLFMKKISSSSIADFEKATTFDYMMAIVNQYGKSVRLYTGNGLSAFEYETEQNGTAVSFFGSVYKSKNAFWVLQFSTTSATYKDIRADIIRWAASVSL